LAAFLNVTPKSHIEVALEKLLMLAGLSNSDKHVVKLAVIFCDWLLQWPKATKISYWILSLFKLLTLDGRSSIVAEVISLKAPKVHKLHIFLCNNNQICKCFYCLQLMEQSIIPVIRGSTAPVLPYFLLTMRDQPQDKVEPILKPAITLVNVLKIQSSKDNETQCLRTELIEGLYVLSDKLPHKEDQLYQSLLRTISVNSINFFV
jgi:hypothetical protein